jgi:hypothetical protein
MAINQIIGGEGLTSNPLWIQKQYNDAERERSLQRALQEQEFRARQQNEQRQMAVQQAMAQQQAQQQARQFAEAQRQYDLDLALKQEAQKQSARQFDASLTQEREQQSLVNMLKQQEMEQAGKITPYQQAKLDLDRENVQQSSLANMLKAQGVAESQQLKNEQLKAKQAEAEQKKQLSQDMVVTSAQDALRAIEEIEKNGGINLFGLRSVVPAIPGTPKSNWNANIDKLTGQLVLDVMTNLKNASRTGATGFGQLSNKELALLQGASTQLRRDLSPQDAQKYLGILKEKYNKIISGQQKQGQTQSGYDPNELMKKYGLQ